MFRNERKQNRWTPTSGQRRLNRLLRLLVAILALSFALIPVLWIVSAAFNPTGSLATQDLIPRNASFQNFIDLFNNPLHPYLIWLWNSVKISSIVVVLSVFIFALSAYAFSRLRFGLRRSLFLGVFLVQIFPSTITIVALFLFLHQIGNYIPFLSLDNHGGLILTYLGGNIGINIWFMKGFFDSIPREIDESAMVDGASHWQIFWFLILPLVRPVLAVVAMLIFVATYNDFLLARVVLKSTEKFTLMVGLYQFTDVRLSENWGLFAAGALIASIPTVLVYMLLQDHIVRGLTTGAVKG